MTDPKPELVPPDPPEVTTPETQIEPDHIDPPPTPPRPVLPRDEPAPENQPLEERDA